MGVTSSRQIKRLNVFQYNVATDGDDASTTDGQVTWSITAGNAQNHFIVNPNTGVVYTAAALDREGISAHVF